MRGLMRRMRQRRWMVGIVGLALVVLSAACAPIKPSPPGPQPDLEIEPASAQFTDTPSGPGTTQTFMITNVGGNHGGVVIELLSLGVAGAFEIAADTCDGVVLDPNEDCTVGVGYQNNSGSGGHDALLVAAAGSSVVVAQLTGTGQPDPPAALTIDPTSANLTDTPSATGTSQVFTVTNTGGTNTAALDLAPLDAAFAISDNTCSGAVLVAAGQCSFRVTYTNDSGAGTHSSSATVNAGPISVSASLIGTGLPDPVLTLTPNLAQFFDSLAEPGPGTVQAFVVKNTGGSPTGSLGGLIIVPAAFSLVSDGCGGMVLSVGAECTITVAYTNTTGAGVEGTLTIKDALHNIQGSAQLIGVAQP